MDKLKEVTDNHEGVYAERTGNRYLLHAQVGASNHEEDKRNAPAHRIRVGEEPTLLAHLNNLRHSINTSHQVREICLPLTKPMWII